jgi:putative transposase
MNRGDRGGAVFRDKLDYEIFLTKLGETCGRTGWRIHSYVLMPNHFHWLVETPEANLVGGMKWFLGAYSQGFNARHGQRGHVFQGRYKALPVEADAGAYFETVSTYIHLNPARARLLEGEDPDLADYMWSSYPWYLKGKPERPVWLEVKRLLGNLRLTDNGKGREGYEEYMRNRIRELHTRSGRRMYREAWKPIRYGWCLGGEGFQEKILAGIGKRMEGKKRASYGGEESRRHDEREAEALVKRGMKALGLKEEDLSCLNKGALVKCALAWHIHRRVLAGHGWISSRLQMGCQSNLTVYINRIQRATDSDARELRRKLESL